METERWDQYDGGEGMVTRSAKIKKVREWLQAVAKGARTFRLGQQRFLRLVLFHY